MAKTDDKSKPSRVRLPPGVEAAFKAADRLQRQLGLSDWQRLYDYLSPDQKAAIKQIETLRREDAQLVEQDVRQRAQTRNSARISRNTFRTFPSSSITRSKGTGGSSVLRSLLRAERIERCRGEQQIPRRRSQTLSEPAPASAKPDQVTLPESIPTPASVEHTETPNTKRGPPLGSFGWVYEQVRKDRALTGGDLKPRCEGRWRRKLCKRTSRRREGSYGKREGIKTKRVGAPRLTGFHSHSISFHLQSTNFPQMTLACELSR